MIKINLFNIYLEIILLLIPGRKFAYQLHCFHTDRSEMCHDLYSVHVSASYTTKERPSHLLHHDTCAWNTCADNVLSLIACQYFKQHIISVLNLAFKKIQILKAKKWTSWKKNPNISIYIKTWTGDRRGGGRSNDPVNLNAPIFKKYIYFQHLINM